MPRSHQVPLHTRSELPELDAFRGDVPSGKAVKQLRGGPAASKTTSDRMLCRRYGRRLDRVAYAGSDASRS